MLWPLVGQGTRKPAPEWEAREPALLLSTTEVGGTACSFEHFPPLYGDRVRRLVDRRQRSLGITFCESALSVESTRIKGGESKTA